MAGLYLPGRESAAQSAPPKSAPAAAATSPQPKAHAHRKKAAPDLPAPQAPAPPPTLEQTTPTPPQVTYNNGELTIVAQNATLSQVLRSVQSQTGASVEMPAGTSSVRVVGQLGPGQPRDVLNALLNGCKFNYIILGVAGNSGAVQKVILTTPKPASPVNTAQNTAAPPPEPQEEENYGEPEPSPGPQTPLPPQMRRRPPNMPAAFTPAAAPAAAAGAANANARHQRRQHAAPRRQDPGTVVAGITADAATAAANAGATESRQPPAAAVDGSPACLWMRRPCRGWNSLLLPTQRFALG